MPAGDVESLFEERVIAFLRDTAAIFAAVEPFATDLNGHRAVVRGLSRCLLGTRKVRISHF